MIVYGKAEEGASCFELWTSVAVIGTVATFVEAVVAVAMVAMCTG